MKRGECCVNRTCVGEILKGRGGCFRRSVDRAGTGAEPQDGSRAINSFRGMRDAGGLGVAAGKATVLDRGMTSLRLSILRFIRLPADRFRAVDHYARPARLAPGIAGKPLDRLVPPRSAPMDGRI